MFGLIVSYLQINYMNKDISFEDKVAFRFQALDKR